MYAFLALPVKMILKILKNWNTFEYCCLSLKILCQSKEFPLSKQSISLAQLLPF